MVLPLVPIAIAGAGALGGFGLGTLFGGSKKEELVQEQTGKIDVVVEAAPYQHYAPQRTFQPTYTQTYTGGDIIVESPGARTTKKTVVDVKPRVDQRGEWDYETGVSPVQELGQEGAVGEGTDMAMIAIIAAVGLVAYGLVSGGKK
jgi:hypothetical protein